MTTVNLDDVLAKLAWAERRFAELKSAERDFLSACPYSTSREPDESGEKEYLIFHQAESPPRELELLLGDAVQNVRSSLDYLVVALADATSGQKLAVDQINKLQFPITTSKAKYDQAAKRWLAGLDAKYVTRIEEVQPYQRLAYTGTTHQAPPPEMDFLAILSDLSNHDKHRRLHVTAVKADVAIWERPGDHSEVGTPPELYEWLTGFDHPLREGDRIARLSPIIGSIDVPFQLGVAHPISGEIMSFSWLEGITFQHIRDIVLPYVAA